MKRAVPAILGLVVAAGVATSGSNDAAAEVPNRAPGARNAGPIRDAGAPESGTPGPNLRIPPDPPPMSEREQWVFDLRWDRGDVYLLEVHKVDMGAPHVTPRVMGRFALELFEGPTLIERVRFDFPMLGAPDAPDAGMRTAPRFEPKLRSRIGVLFPATKRGTRLELWDRARDVRMPLAWPPKEGPAGPVPDAGSQSAPAPR